MDHPCAWGEYTAEQAAELEEFCNGYRAFISENKTERECAASAIKRAEAAGYISLDSAIASGEALKPGDKIYASNRGKTVALVHLGTEPLERGLNILGAHIDCPRLDIKQNPLEEKNGLAYLDTHYYGGIKKYQWVTMPLAIHGVVALKDGSVVTVALGEGEDDPVFYITDLLPHLGGEQMAKKATEVIEGEMLDVLVGSRPLAAEDGDERKDPVKSNVISLLREELGIEEEDLLSAELEVVPAGKARELGFDRSMILGYGQDDRSCSYTSLIAQLDTEAPKRTAVCLLVDKEEIGSVGATGMRSRWFEDVMAEILELAGEGGSLPLRRCLERSCVLSNDVSVGYDPAFPSVYDPKNAAYLGHGVSFIKFTGARGKSGSNDANAEYVAALRRVMDEAGVHWQTSELGKVDAGGGGTISYMLANYGMSVIDCGIPVLSMHAPWEVTSKADVFEAYRAYKAFLKLE